MGNIVAAGATVHAPQLFTRPPTEDLRQLDADVAAMQRLGETMLDGPQPDALIIFGSDHLETFFLDAAPTFALVSGERCRCSFAGRGYEAAIHQPLAEALLTGLVEADFDMVYAQEITLGHAYAVPFEFVLGGRQIPVVPVFINTYLPPLPSARRCAALGAAIARIVAARPERVALLASGGLSHYPGTWKYPQPAFNFDRWAIAQMEHGNIEALLSLTNQQLDAVGNTEMLPWMALFGAIGALPGELLSYQPTWHHGHAVMQFLPPPTIPPSTAEPPGPYAFPPSAYEFYAHPAPSAYRLNRLLRDLTTDAALRARFIADPAAVATERQLAPREAAVIGSILDEDIDLLRNLRPHPVVEAGAHPLGNLMALLVVQAEIRRLRKQGGGAA
jgi:2,3-dihydroxyphenylpropionate 1,2-dioxygenase